MGSHRLLGSENLAANHADQLALQEGSIIDISHLNLSFAGQPINRCSKAIWNELQKLLISTNEDERGIELMLLISKLLAKSSIRRGLVELPLDYFLEQNQVNGWSLTKSGDQLAGQDHCELIN